MTNVMLGTLLCVVIGKNINLNRNLVLAQDSCDKCRSSAWYWFDFIYYYMKFHLVDIRHELVKSCI